MGYVYVRLKPAAIDRVTPLSPMAYACIFVACAAGRVYMYNTKGSAARDSVHLRVSNRTVSHLSLAYGESIRFIEMWCVEVKVGGKTSCSRISLLSWVYVSKINLYPSYTL